MRLQNIWTITEYPASLYRVPDSARPDLQPGYSKILELTSSMFWLVDTSSKKRNFLYFGLFAKTGY